MTVAEARSAVGEHGGRGRGGRQGPRRGRSAVACRLASSVDYPHVDQLGLIALYIVWFHHVRLRPKPNLNLNSNNQGHIDKGTDKVKDSEAKAQGFSRSSLGLMEGKPQRYKAPTTEHHPPETGRRMPNTIKYVATSLVGL